MNNYVKQLKNDIHNLKKNYIPNHQEKEFHQLEFLRLQIATTFLGSPSSLVK